MVNIEGQLTFEVIRLATKQDEHIEVDAGEFEAECEQLDTDDDKRRVETYLTYRGHAFDGNAEFTVRVFFDVFGSNVFRNWTAVEDVTPGYTVSRFDMPGDGLSVEAKPIRQENDVEPDGEETGDEE